MALRPGPAIVRPTRRGGIVVEAVRMTKSDRTMSGNGDSAPAPTNTEAASAAAFRWAKSPAPVGGSVRASGGRRGGGDARAAAVPGPNRGAMRAPVGHARAGAAPDPEVSVRTASAEDAGAIAEIGVRSWQAAYRGILPGGFLAGLSVAPREIAWRSMLESEASAAAEAWIVELEGRPVGFATSGPPRDEDVPLPAAEVYAIYVLPEAWRRGAGRALLEVTLNRWRERGATTLVLWVFAANARVRAFYEALGWRRDGTRQVIELGGVHVLELRYRLRPDRP